MIPTIERLTSIAREHLGIETLQSCGSDALDFHNVSAWGVKGALQAAYDAGVNASTAKADTPATDMPIVTVEVRSGMIEDMDATIPLHVVVEDWDIPDYDTEKKPARNIWTLTAGLSVSKAAKLRRLIANQ